MASIDEHLGNTDVSEYEEVKELLLKEGPVTYINPWA